MKNRARIVALHGIRTKAGDSRLVTSIPRGNECVTGGKSSGHEKNQLRSLSERATTGIQRLPPRFKSAGEAWDVALQIAALRGKGRAIPEGSRQVAQDFATAD